MRIAICPGSFDPVTIGHLDIITRASELFDKIIVVVMDNAQKNNYFIPEERVEMLQTVIAASGLKNVETDIYHGLLADYVTVKKAIAIVKGLRAVSDFEYEFQMAMINKKLAPSADTVFLTTRTENMYLSSSIVRQVASFGGDISPFVPAVVHSKIVDRLKVKR